MSKAKIGRIYKNIWNEYYQVVKVEHNGREERIEVMRLGDNQPDILGVVYGFEWVQYFHEFQ